MHDLPPSSGDDPDQQAQDKSIYNHPLTFSKDCMPRQDTIIVTFADHNHKLEVNKALICRNSKFFANAFNIPMSELLSNKIELHEVSPSTFCWFLGCIDNQDILINAKLNADTFIDWVELYKFADFAGVRGLCNNISSIAHDWLKTMCQIPFEIDDIKAMVKYLPFHAGLRKLLIVAAPNTFNTNHGGQCELAIRLHYPSDLSDAMLSCCRIPVIGYPQCDFHEHRSWEECELCGEFRDGKFLPPFSAGSSEGW